MKTELMQGWNGRGDQIWIVTKTQGARVVSQERFDNKAEAEAWVKWS